MFTLDVALARLAGVKPCAGGWVARCPAHEDRKPSLSIRERDNGKVLLKCFAGCDYRQIAAALNSAPANNALARPATALKSSADAETRIEVALGIWREAREPRGTIVQDYLFGRGFTGEMPWKVERTVDYQVRRRLRTGLSIPASIRFHPSLKHPSGAYLPAMVAAIEDLDGSIVGIHRTFLKPDGTGKADVEPKKMALGRLKGCAVHLTAGGAEIVVCEGVETGLSILQATGQRVWTALGTSNLGQVEMPGFVREIILAADHDEPGLRAARAAAESYKARGALVQIVSPAASGADFSDLRDGG
jgi:putative DNA primase/helicase